MRLTTVAMLLALGALLLGLGLSAWNITLEAAGPLKVPVELMIENGAGVNRIGTQLEKAGVINDARLFKLAVRQLGLAGKLQAGDYSFDPGMSLRAVVEKIGSGKTTPHTLTIPEGYTTRQVLDVISATTILSGTIVKRPGEGELFPDTYSFHLNTTRQKLLDEMKKRMDGELQKAWAAHQPMLPYNGAEDLLILASIVQKEAANESEMPQIAGVFVNRLNKKMRLQSDPTVIYGADQYQGDIRRKDLADENPFNTYKNDGLPPTPICNPGQAALLAAAQPASTTALFFVAAASGTGHVFSDTYAEHQKNVAKLVKATAPAKPAAKTVAKPAAKPAGKPALQPSKKPEKK